MTADAAGRLWADLLAVPGARRDEFGNLADCCAASFRDGRTLGHVEGAAAARAAAEASWQAYMSRFADNAARSIDVDNARARAAGRPPVHGVAS